MMQDSAFKRHVTKRMLPSFISILIFARGKWFSSAAGGEDNGLSPGIGRTTWLTRAQLFVTTVGL
jgi:hypothetical protein